MQVSRDHGNIRDPPWTLMKNTLDRTAGQTWEKNNSEHKDIEIEIAQNKESRVPGVYERQPWEA